MPFYVNKGAYVSLEREVFMNTEQYIEQLMEEIKDFSEQDKKQIKEYFEEMIYDRMEDGESESDILKKLGSPKDVSYKLKLEYESYLEREEVPQTEDKKTISFSSLLKKDENSSANKEMPTSIFVQAENVKIIALRENIPYPQVEFDEDKQVDLLSITEENGCFKVVHKIKKLWFLGLIGFHKTKSMILHIPTAFHGDLTLISCNSSIQLRDFDSLTELHCNTSNSKISVENVTANKMSLKTSNSSIRLENISGGDILAKTSNSKILLDRATFSNTIDFITSNAPIEVHGIVGKSIKLHTSNSSVKGEISGSIVDYNIISSTSNGSSTLPSRMNTGKDKDLTVKTSNAKINLTFEQDQ